MSQAPIPFTMRVSDYSQLEGLLHFQEESPAELRLEFYHKETILNVFGSQLKEATISLDKLNSVEHKEGWFSDRLGIQFQRMSDAEAIPGSKMGRVDLKIKKMNRDALKMLVVDIDLALAQHRLDRLEQS